MGEAARLQAEADARNAREAAELARQQERDRIAAEQSAQIAAAMNAQTDALRNIRVLPAPGAGAVGGGGGIAANGAGAGGGGAVPQGAGAGVVPGPVGGGGVANGAQGAGGGQAAGAGLGAGGQGGGQGGGAQFIATRATIHDATETPPVDDQGWNDGLATCNDWQDIRDHLWSLTRDMVVGLAERLDGPILARNRQRARKNQLLRRCMTAAGAPGAELLDDQ